MTEQELRVLDGPALTMEAFRVGLAPKSAIISTCPPRAIWIYSEDHGFENWEPHTNLAQADACLRGIRERYHSTNVHGAHHDAEGQGGYCTAWNALTREGVHVYWGAVESPRDPDVVATEAQALLLCAVLAVSQRGAV